MQLTKPAKFTMARATAEAAALHMQGKIRTEHVFLGLLKTAEMSPDDFSSRKSENWAKITREIDSIKTIFKKLNINTTKFRYLVRKIMREEKTEFSFLPDKRTDIAELIKQSTSRATKAGCSILRADIILETILNNHPPALLILFDLVANDSKSGGDQQATPRYGENDNMGIIPNNKLHACDSLSQLTIDIKKMHYLLLDKIFGQDHAIHTFTEGMFNAELLSNSDKSRKSPKGIFIFCGPPGVGKTYLAEQAAETINIPFKRFDMSDFSDHQQHLDLIGMGKAYKDAKEGTLTGFVKQKPNCILLFDEIEKAHINCIHLFLQILDSGRLQDKFTGNNVYFRNSIIIFTTNAGQQLYEDENNNKELSRKTILNALESDTNQNTGHPFFPAAICSRLATGYPILFNHLHAHDLINIAELELQRATKLFASQYSIALEMNNKLSSVLLFSEGGRVDARTIRARTEIFLKNEIHKLCRLFNSDSFAKTFYKLKTIFFEVETEELNDDIAKIFTSAHKAEVLLFTTKQIAGKFRKLDLDFTWNNTLIPEEAFRILGEKDNRFILFQPLIIKNDKSSPLSQVSSTINTLNNFDKVPIAASGLRNGLEFLKKLRERMPEIPVYLIESDDFAIDDELETSFVRAGVRGKILAPTSANGEIIQEKLKKIANELYLQQTAITLAAEQKVINFESAPKIDNQEKITIRIRNMMLMRTPFVEDSKDILDNVDKPNVKFNDIFGANNAKDELRFFVEYLKNPKKFTALGLKAPKGVLLHGPPGTGKTMLAKAMAGESNVAFIPTVASSFVTKWQGSGPEAIQALFTYYFAASNRISHWALANNTFRLLQYRNVKFPLNVAFITKNTPDK